MKYIVYENNGKERIITFAGDPGEPHHKDVAEALGLKNIVAAGFFMEIGERKFFTGESTSLDIKSRGDIDRDLYIQQSMR